MTDRDYVLPTIATLAECVTLARGILRDADQWERDEGAIKGVGYAQLVVLARSYVCNCSNVNPVTDACNAYIKDFDTNGILSDKAKVLNKAASDMAAALAEPSTILQELISLSGFQIELDKLWWRKMLAVRNRAAHFYNFELLDEFPALRRVVEYYLGEMNPPMDLPSQDFYQSTNCWITPNTLASLIERSRAMAENQALLADMVFSVKVHAEILLEQLVGSFAHRSLNPGTRLWQASKDFEQTGGNDRVLKAGALAKACKVHGEAFGKTEELDLVGQTAIDFVSISLLSLQLNELELRIVPFKDMTMHKDYKALSDIFNRWLRTNAVKEEAA